jgi:hypothetical protein
VEKTPCTRRCDHRPWADVFIVGFEHREDERFLAELRGRFAPQRSCGSLFSRRGAGAGPRPWLLSQVLDDLADYGVKVVEARTLPTRSAACYRLNSYPEPW